MDYISEWILISLLIVAILVVVSLIIFFIVLYKKKKEGKMGEPKYKVFFTIGIAWIPIGVVFMITVHPVIGMSFMALGVSYMAIGLANRNKWNKEE